MAVLDPEELTSHYHVAQRDLLDNIIVPFLGAGVSVCNRRPRDAKWEHGVAFLPTGGELSSHLASRFRYSGDPTDLARVAEFVSLMSGPASLKQVFNAVYPLTDVHRFLAQLPALTVRKTGRRQCPLIVTTNYDDLLERAFDEAGEPYHLVMYIADGPAPTCSIDTCRAAGASSTCTWAIPMCQYPSVSCSRTLAQRSGPSVRR